MNFGTGMDAIRMPGKMLSKFALAAVLGAAVVLPAGAAYAQFPMPSISLQGEPKRKLTPEEQEKQKKLDDAYQSATNKIPDKKTTSDPWGTVRSSPSTASKSKQQ